MQPKFRTESFDGMKAETCYVGSNSDDLCAESYESLIEQELQQIWRETADVSPSFVEKREKDDIRVSYDTDRNGQAAAFAFYRWKQRGYSTYL